MTVSKYLNLKNLLLVTTMLASPVAAVAPITAMAQIGISIQIEPPVLPIYEQPPIPEVGYIWTPGYWAYDNEGGYFWVPGTWVQPPQANVLWTPPYWGWADGAYQFHDGYWGEHVGYYGGVNYGYGYGGSGYEGGRWEGGNFAYNGTVNNFGGTRVTNVYQSNVTVANNSQVSFAGGPHGLTTQPSAADRVALREHHIAVTADQTRHFTEAAKNPALAAKQNGGHPAIAATARPAQFTGPGIVPARAAGAEHPIEHNGVVQTGAGREAPVEHAAPPREATAPHPAEHQATAHTAPVEHAAPPREAVAPHPAEHQATARIAPVQHAAAPRQAPPAHPAQQHAPPAHPAATQVAHVQPVQHAAPAPVAQHPAVKAPPAKQEEKKPEH
jgi:hypothetical protein